MHKSFGAFGREISSATPLKNGREGTLVLLSLTANATRSSVRKSSYCTLENDALKDLFQPRRNWALNRPRCLLENTKIRSRTLVSRRKISALQRFHLILFVRYQFHF